MADFYIGQIIPFAGNFAIKNFAFCNGQLLSIAQNTALFSILGTTYGGNGTTTFALPNLQGSFPMHFNAQNPLGAIGGSASVTLTTANLPAHNHLLNVNNGLPNASDPTGNFLAQPNSGTAKQPGNTTYSYTSAAATGTANTQAISLTGGSQPVSITPPYVAINYLICLYGIFPSRN